MALIDTRKKILEFFSGYFSLPGVYNRQWTRGGCKGETVIAVNETLFARLFIQHRKRIGRTPTDLAVDLGISPGYVFNIESGARKPTKEIFETAVERFGLNAVGRQQERQVLYEAWLYTRANEEGRLLAELREARTSRLTDDMQKEGLLSCIYVPVVGQCPGGDPAMYTNGEYPVGFAEKYIPVPAEIVQEHPGAFAVRIIGDSMAPRYNDGSLVLSAPDAPAEDGRPAIVCLQDGTLTCKILRTSNDQVVLDPENRAHKPLIIRREEIAWAYRVINAFSVEK